ncbi:MAG TPA: hypothetical protein VFQ53_13340 [Kofleriaceae bacterium]|nr:hypothetical protein [Kofleriaceae bacterium]
MRSIRALGLASVLACAACGDGIYVEVHVPVGVKIDEVQLVVGDRPCRVEDNECFGIRPMGFPDRIGDADDIFFDANAQDVIIEPVVDGVATFQFQPTDGLGQILVLGRADGKAFPDAAAVMVPISLSNSRVKYVVQLQPAEPLTFDPAQQRPIGVAQWTSPEGITCYAVEDYKNGRGPVFVVPDSDPDCDSIAAERECSPLVYLDTSGRADPTNPTCIGTFPTHDLLQACMLGGSGCDETVGTSSVCSPSGWCIPDAVCSQCSSGDFFDPTCVESVARSDSTARIACRIEVEPNPDVPGDDRVCTNGPIPAIVASTTAGITCAGLPGIARFDQFPQFQDATQDDTGNSHIATLKLVNFSAPCNFELETIGMIDPNAVNTGVPAITELVKLDMAFTQGRAIVMPLQITFVDSGCTGQTVCEMTSTDGAYSCGDNN